MNTSTRLFLFALFVSLTCLPAFSQDLKCEKTESIEQCIQKRILTPIGDLRQDPATATTTTVKSATNEAVKKDQPGATSSGSQARSTVTDLLPWFDMLGLLSDSDASDGTLAADLNFLLPWNDGDKTGNNSQLKWQLDVSPELSEDIVAAIPEDVRGDRKKELEGDLDDTADSELQFSYSVVNDRYGRDFRRHYGRLAALIAPVMVNAETEAEKQVRKDARFALDDAIFNLKVDASKPISELRLTEDQRKELEKAILDARANLAPAYARQREAIQSALGASGVNDLTRLVLLQPQILFSANRRIRDEAVGPESWGFKVTYERSFVSLNDFFDDAGGKCPRNTTFDGTVLELAAVQPCLKELREYMKEHEEEIENESRWKASLEYKKIDRWQFSLPDDGVAIDRPKYDRIIASAGFGRVIPRSAVKDRVDFEAAYDSNLDDDDSYKSRLVVTLTYTRRIGEMDVPFSVVYANKSEFLEGTDKQIGVHIGLKFRGLEAQ